MTVGEGQDFTIFKALDDAERNNSWLIIADLHLASETFLAELKQQFHRLGKVGVCGLGKGRGLWAGKSQEVCGLGKVTGLWAEKR